MTTRSAAARTAVAGRNPAAGRTLASGCLAAAVALAALFLPVAPASAQDGGVPQFEVDPSWPRLPDGWVLGQVASVAVDSRDHVWVLHRPLTVSEEERANAAPPVIELGPNGAVVQAWGGPTDDRAWPGNEHGIPRRRERPRLGRRQQRTGSVGRHAAEARGRRHRWCCRSATAARARATTTPPTSAGRPSRSCTRRRARSSCGRLRQSARHRDGCRDGGVPAAVGRLRQRAARSAAGGAGARGRGRRRGRTAAVRYRARHRGVGRRARLRRRPEQQPHPDLRGGRDLRAAGVRQPGRGERADRGRHRLLARRRAALRIRRRPGELAHPRARPRDARDPRLVRAEMARRRASSRPCTTSPATARATSTPRRPSAAAGSRSSRSPVSRRRTRCAGGAEGDGAAQEARGAEGRRRGGRRRGAAHRLGGARLAGTLDVRNPHPARATRAAGRAVDPVRRGSGGDRGGLGRAPGGVRRGSRPRAASAATTRSGWTPGRASSATAGPR